jgi:hypothetical protein
MAGRDATTVRETGERGREGEQASCVARGLGPLSMAEACAGMLVQNIQVSPPDVVFVKGIVEASDGIAVIFAERGGDLTLAAPLGRAGEFAELLRDLELDVGARLSRSV